MTVFTGWTGWLIFAALILAGWLLLGVAAAAAWHLTKRAWQRSLGVRPGAPRQQPDDLFSYGDRLIRTLNAEAECFYPAPARRDLAWQQFVDGHDWPAGCADCVWWVPAPSEAEDAIAVYRPCKAHEHRGTQLENGS